MTTEQERSQPAELDDASFAIDVFGIKGNVEFGEAETAPTSWRDVCGLVNARLRSIIVNAVGALDDAVRSLRRSGHRRLRSGGDVERSRALARAREDQAQADTTRGMRPSAVEAESRIKDLIDRLAARGVRVALAERADGVLVVVVGPTELHPALAARGAETTRGRIRAPRNTPEEAGVGRVAEITTIDFDHFDDTAPPTTVEGTIINISRSGVLFESSDGVCVPRGIQDPFSWIVRLAMSRGDGYQPLHFERRARCVRIGSGPELGFHVAFAFEGAGNEAFFASGAGV